MTLPWFLSGNWLSLWIIAAILLLIWIFDRKKFRKEGFLFYLRRTARGLTTIDRASKRKRFWHAFGDAGLLFAFGWLGVWYLFRTSQRSVKQKIAIATSYLILSTAAVLWLTNTFAAILALFQPPAQQLPMLTTILAVFTAALGTAGFAFALIFLIGVAIAAGKILSPQIGIALPFELPAGLRLPIISIPMVEWFVAVFLVLVVHEFSHAIVARAENIRVRALGYGFLGPIPLGFAEPDEAQIKRTAPIKRARILAAGSFANALLGIVFVLLFFGLFTNVYAGVAAGAFSGIEYTTMISENQTFPSAALPAGGLITHLNGMPIENLSRFRGITQELNPGETINLTILDEGTEVYMINTTEDPNNASRAYIGILVSAPCSFISIKSSPCGVRDLKPELQNVQGSGIIALFYISRALFWLALINLGVAVINLLPIAPLFDGGLLATDLLKKTSPRRWKFFITAITATTIFLLLLNIFGPGLGLLISSLFG